MSSCHQSELLLIISQCVLFTSATNRLIGDGKLQSNDRRAVYIEQSRQRWYGAKVFVAALAIDMLCSQQDRLRRPNEVVLASELVSFLQPHIGQSDDMQMCVHNSRMHSMTISHAVIRWNDFMSFVDVLTSVTCSCLLLTKSETSRCWHSKFTYHRLQVMTSCCAIDLSFLSTNVCTINHRMYKSL